MKRVVTLIAVLLILTGSMNAKSLLSLEQDSFDFGIVPNNAKTSHTFWLKSTGDDTLKILKIIPGCGCTQVPLSKKEIAPGDSSALEIIFSSGQRNGKTVKHPSILTNESIGRRKLTFNANITHSPDTITPVKFTPYKLFVSKAGEVDIKETTFAIENVSGNDILIKLVSTPPEIFTIDIPNEIKAGESGEGKILVNEAFLSKSFEKSITFEVNDDQKTRITIPVVRRLIGVKSAQK